MSSYTIFAVAGAGRVGKAVIQHLQAEGVQNIVILSRKADEVVVGVPTIAVDYEKQQSLIDALHGRQVLISTFGPGSLAAQNALIDCAPQTQVELFVLSEFGFNLQEPHPYQLSLPTVQAKKAAASRLRGLKIPSLRLFTGNFSDMMTIPRIGLDFANAKVILVGKGEQQVSFTTLDDSARFLAHILVHSTKKQLADSEWYVEGDRKSMSEIFDIAERRTGQKMQIKHESIEAAIERFRQDGSPLDYLRIGWNLPYSSTGGKDNKAWPEWRPQSVEQAVFG